MSGTVALFCSSLLLVLSLTAAERMQVRRDCSFNDTVLAEGDGRSPHETNPQFIWPGGKIPYEFTYTVEKDDREVFKYNMRRIQDHSCFEFEPRNSRYHRGKKYLEIDVPGDAGSCGNGRFSAHVTNKYLVRGTKNALLLFSKYKLADQDRCKQPGNKEMFEGGILHEMFHALGIGHTQRRPDRDTYIQVFPDNIQNPSQYNPCKDCKLYPKVPYECNSVMHYGYETFRKPGHGHTMRGRNGCTVTAWGSSIPTSNDWRLVKIIGGQYCKDKPTNSGRWSAWQDHGYCSVTCGTGMRKQTRTCIGGTGCIGDSERFFSCKQAKCKVECNWYDWWC